MLGFTGFRAALASACGQAVGTAAGQDIGRFSNPAANDAFYASTQTYRLPVVLSAQASLPVDVAKVAPEAGHLLTAAFPSLTLAQANQILSETLGSGGGFVDDGSAFGIYSRLKLYEGWEARCAAAGIPSREALRPAVRMPRLPLPTR